MDLGSAAAVTVSDGVTDGTRADTSGDLLVRRLSGLGFGVDRHVVADERVLIRNLLAGLSSNHGLVVTTGGTGFGPQGCDSGGYG